MYDSDRLIPFYRDSYSRSGDEAELYSRWRALGALGKADHVIALCRAADVAPASTLEVGCGDGALLSQLARRGFGGRLAGVEITDAAVALAATRPGIDSIRLYDGSRLPFGDGEFELGVLSHVLEHVHDPVALLAETARVCGCVCCEVPLERNWSARRHSARERSDAVGHIQLLDRGRMRAVAADAGLHVVAELEDPLPLRVHRFFATGPWAHGAAFARGGARAGVHRIAPPLARRAFTLHYACLCLPRPRGA